MEVWKDVIGYEGYYQVSNLGKVRSLDRVRINKNNVLKLYKGKILNGCINNLGYDCYDLFDINGVRKNIKGHFLVAFHFCENYKNGLVVNHKNGIKHDNNHNNLEWISFHENVKHAFKTRLIVHKGLIIVDLQTGIFFDSVREAYRSKIFKYSLSHFRKMIDGKKTNISGLIAL